MSRCVRCGWPEQAHYGMAQPILQERPICRRYVQPAPWWLRLLTTILPR